MFPKLLKLSIISVMLFFGAYHHSSAFTVSRPSTLNNGLVGYWTFDGADVNFTTNQAIDRSGNGNNGTLTNMSTSTARAPGKIGQALKFDGVDDYVDVGDPVSGVLDFGTGDFTISAWIKTANKSLSGSLRIINKRNSASGVGYEMYIENNDNKLEFYVSDSGGYTFGSGGAGAKNIRDSNWHNVGVVFNRSGNAIFYVDGIQDGTPKSISSRSGDIGHAGKLFLGSSVAGPANFFNGLIDEVRVYNRALSASEVKQLYNQSASKFNKTPTNTLTSGLVGYWTFDGADVTDKVYDKSGQGNHGYFYGGATTTAKVPGKIGQALKFDGTNDYVNIGDPVNESLDFGTNSFSVSFWMKTMTTVFSIPISKGSYGTPGYDIYLTPTSNVNLNLHLYGNFGGVLLSGAVPLNTWVHYVGIVDRTGGGFNLFGYNNGTLYSTYATSTTMSLSNDRSFIFGDSSIPGYPFNGLIDEVRVYNRALSSNEVKQLYNMGR